MLCCYVFCILWVESFFLMMKLPAAPRICLSFILGSSYRSGVLGLSRFIASSTAAKSCASSAPATRMQMSSTTEAVAMTNPLLADWSSRSFHMPPFEEIETNHFEPALMKGMEVHLKELQDIVDNPEAPSFENTIAEYDRCGSLLDKVASVYGNLCSSLNTDELQEVQRKFSPILAKHSSQCYMLPGLYPKIKTVFDECQAANGDSGLTPEQKRLVERIHMDFTRAGAHFSEDQQKEYAATKAELATLTTQFQQNVMKDESEYELVVTLEDLEGCPSSLVEAAKQAAAERNKDDDKYVITLSRSLVEPFLMYCPNRALRKEAWEAWTSRGELAEDRNNVPIAKKILQLRQRQAELHGYKSFAEYQCVDRMAKTPEAVMELLENVWERAKESARKERESLEAYMAKSGTVWDGGIQPWDWRYVAEQVRKDQYDFDQSSLKPYLSLEAVRDAMFAVSGNLYGLDYVPRPDIKVYHPDVDVYEVRDKTTKQLVSLFLHDNFSRPFKSSGAWMSEYRSQTKNLPSGAEEIDGIPIVSNNNNLAKGGSKTFLSHDDATTMFHEFGHAHHGMLSDATYGRLASTNVMTDFVELPSQLMEHWFNQREILQKYAVNEQGESIPQDLLDKLKAAESFNQGFETIEYTACALLDMAMHSLDDYSDFDLVEFEKKELERLGMPQGIVMRHRPAHFSHLFATEYYAAGYYVYLWAEVLDADAFQAFLEAGDIFDPSTAEKARKFIYSAGNTQAPDELFRQFRGRDPDIKFMLKKKGLMADE